MAKKTTTFTVEGDSYTMTQFGGVEGIGYFHELRKLALPVLASIVTGPELATLLLGKGENIDLEKLPAETGGKLVAAVVELMTALPKKLELDLACRFAENCMIMQGPAAIALANPGAGLQPDGIFDQHFAGRYTAYTKWFLQGLRFNFAGFLGSSGNSGSPAAQP